MNSFSHDVIGIGNAIVDILSRCGDDFLQNFDLPKGHMQLIDSDRADQLYQAMGPAIEISGGSAANTCAGLASFGSKAAFIGKVRDDQFGRVFAHDIQSIGVTFQTPKALTGAPTARCLVLVTPDGERTMNTFLGASVEFGDGEIDEILISESKILYLEGYLYDPPEAQSAFHSAAEFAKKSGAKVALSLSDSFCVDRHRSTFLNFIKSKVDILFANEEEICALYETQSLEDAIQAVSNDCSLAALTRSSKGSIIVNSDDRIEVAAEPVQEIVDTTGAGDLYAAGFLHGYAQNLHLANCGKLASLAASEIISHLGARPEQSLHELAKKHGYLS